MQIGLAPLGSAPLQALTKVVSALLMLPVEHAARQFMDRADRAQPRAGVRLLICKLFFAQPAPIGYTRSSRVWVRCRSRFERLIGVGTVHHRSCKIIVVVLAQAIALQFGGALADDDSKRKRRDHEVAREALTNGEIRPLEAIIAEVRRTVPGDIVGIELEKYSGQWVYKIKVIAPSGAMQRVNIDARGSAVTPSSAGLPATVAPGSVAPQTAPPAAADQRSR